MDVDDLCCRRGSKLKILRASSTDNGVYQCWVRNIAGQTYANAMVVVEGEYHFIFHCGYLPGSQPIMELL